MVVGRDMPVVAIFDGIKIEFYANEHPPPHYHARYGEFIAQIEIVSGRMMNGRLPPAQARKVEQWAGPRVLRLMAAWKAMQNRRKPEKISG